jgi:RHS repeat-associated protein
MPLSTKTGGRTLYPLRDANSSVTAVTDGSGNVVERYRYGAFGQPYDVPANTADSYTYAGREWDAGAGAYYMRARWYDPGSGRFLSEDPLPATNSYSYAGNSPLAFTDPTGMFSLAEEEATMVLEDDLAAAEAQQFENGFLYSFMRAMRAGSEAGERLYIGITNNIARREAEHEAAGYMTSDLLDSYEVEVTSRIQLRALEQARMLARGGKDALANAINAMSETNWDAVGRELVDRWISRNPEAPADLMRDVTEGLMRGFGG